MTKQFTASHLGLPPPAQCTLHDGDRAIGWTTEASEPAWRKRVSRSTWIALGWQAFRWETAS